MTLNLKKNFRFPILLEGETSAGKTSIVCHLAKITGNKIVRINNHEHTDVQEWVKMEIFEKNPYYHAEIG